MNNFTTEIAIFLPFDGQCSPNQRAGWGERRGVGAGERSAIQTVFQQSIDIILIKRKIMIGIQHLKQFAGKLKQISFLGSILDQYEDSYNLRRYRISEISIQEAQKMYQNIEKKFYKYYSAGESGTWFENELKIFIWLLVCYIEHSKKHVRQFDCQDWAFFRTIFYVKHPVLFEYQAKITLDYSLCLQKWTHQQDQMLSKIVSGAIKIKWSEIAKSLFTSSEGKYVRTSKQCRERWLNHLDPSKTKLTWTFAECKALLESVLEKGKKWASLVHTLHGRRSQHSIKNKYNSMLIKQSKLTPCQTQQQNCRSLLGELSIILSTNLAQTNSPIFRDCVSSAGGAQAQLQQDHLQKSNASLSLTLNLNVDDPKEMSLNLDDIWLTTPVENISELPDKGIFKSKGRKLCRQSENLEVQRVDDDPIVDEMESIVYLGDIKLMIRESELDR